MGTVTDGRLDFMGVAADAAAVDELRGSVGEQLVSPDDPGYDQARRVWNGMIDRRPALIVRCRGVADVVASVRFARTTFAAGGSRRRSQRGRLRDLRRRCGHRPVADAWRSCGRRARKARAAGGATWADLDRETQLFGLAAPGGFVSTTGIAGLTLGGGQGWLRRTYGMACDSLISADVVTADGELVIASERDNADLFWALRGGGGNFGVVTSFEYQLHPVGPMVAFAGPVYPLESLVAVIGEMRRFAADAPDEVNISATLWTIPAVDAFPAELHGRAVVILGAIYVGAPDHGEPILDRCARSKRRSWTCRASFPTPPSSRCSTRSSPRQEHHYWKSTYLADLGDDAVSIVAAHAASRPSPMSMIGLWALGGAFSRVDATATASGARNAPFVLEILANWTDPNQAAANIGWARQLFEDMTTFSTGKANFNFPGLGDDPNFARSALGDNWDRLVDVKRKYDPTNLFRLNQNIDPTTAT